MLICNWKTFITSVKEAKSLFGAYSTIAKNSDMEIVACPPAHYLSYGTGKNFKLGAQDVSEYEGGENTGELVAGALTELGATYAIVGHSEHRARGSTNEAINKKIKKALAIGIVPILCIGEDERDTGGNYLSFLEEQLRTALQDLSKKEISEIVIAYEPIWAIGDEKHRTITSEDLHETVLFIRKIIGEICDGAQKKIKILYGGSVFTENVSGLCMSGLVDGFMLGRASVDKAELKKIVKEVNEKCF